MSELLILPTITCPADLKKLPIDQLPQLAAEIRQAICDQVSKTGGHLAPNLGVVELTIALHYVFDIGAQGDRLLFDVGHQCYPHKLLTGRYPKLNRLRQRDGMAGFPEPTESAYDLFSVGHAGTGVSTAVGMARGDQINGESHRKTVALVGDSSIVNGLSLEGLNNAGTLKRQFLVILNDNGMSIGKPQGALSQYFDRVRVSTTFKDIKHRAHEVIKRLPGSEVLEQAYHRIGEMTKAAMAHDHMFEQFGLLCVGPIDGHDIPALIEMLNEVKDIDHPVLLHVKTVKGKGFTFTEGDATTFHSPKPFKVTGCRVEVQSGGRSFTSAFADAMTSLMTDDQKITCVTAGMPDGTGVNKLIPAFPDRAFDVGIAESHAMDMMAGMAKTGLKPFAVIYSTFTQRAFDQLFQEVSLQGLPVRVCMDRAGLVGGDGAVHHGFLDVAFMRSLPGVVLTAVYDEPTLKAALRFMADYQAGPSAVRYPRDNVPTPPYIDKVEPFQLGKAVKIADGNDLAILAYGFPVNASLKAREILADHSGGGIHAAVYDARFAKPVDIELLRSLIESNMPIITVEDHATIGGFGSCVLEACNQAMLPTHRIKRLGLPDRFIMQDSRGNQLKEAGIDPDSIAAAAQKLLEKIGVTSRT
ncbi:MAG: 1-deoxy-D-xylulose-5-phosphate synthase [Phycisphaerales bacterium]